MGSYADYKNKYRSAAQSSVGQSGNFYEQYKQRTGNAAQTSTSGSTVAERPKSAYQRYRERMASAQSLSSVDTRLNRFLTDYNSFLDAAEKDRKSIGYTNAGGMLESRIKTAAKLRQTGQELSVFLQANKDQFDGDAYGQAMSEVSNAMKGVDSIMSTFGDSVKYYSQWETEDDYKAHVAEQEKYTYDIEAGEKEIAELEAKREAYAENTEYDWTSYQSRTAYQEGLDRLDAEIATKRQYLESAKQLQAEKASLEKMLGGYDKTTHSAEAQAGWSDYLATQEQIEKNRQEAEQNRTWFDKLGEYLGTTSDTSLPLHMTGEVTKGVQTQDDKLRYPTDDWNEDQRLTFGYLWATNRQNAWQYAKMVNTELNQQKEQTKLQQIRDAATSSLGAGAAHTVGAILSAPAGLADTLGNMIEMGTLGHLLESDGEITPYEYSEAVTGGISQHLNEAGGVIDEDVPVIGGKGWGDVYGLGTSIAQSMLAAHTGGAGQAILTTFGPAVQSGIESAKARGATDKQAVTLGLMSGLSEALAEQIGVDNLLKIGSSGTMKELVLNILRQGAAEGLEEGITSVATNFADRLVMADKSEYNLAVLENMRNGMGKTEAEKKAWLDMAEGVLYDMLAGFASGGIQGGVETGIKTGIQAVQTRAQNQQLGQQIIADDGLAALRQLANEVAGVTEGDVQKQLQAQAEKASGEKVKTRDVGKLYSMVQSAATPETMARLDTAERRQDGAEAAAEVTQAAAVDTLSQNENNAPEGVYTASEDGKSYLKSTGDAVSVMGVASVKDGSMKLKLEDGRTVDAQDVAYGSEDEALVYETVADMGVNALAANMLIENYTPGGDVSAAVYVNGIKEAYMAGTLNIPQAELATMPFASELAGYQRSAAYQLGELFGGKRTAKEQTGTVAKTSAVSEVKAVRKRGTVKSYGVRIADMNKAFNSTQRQAYKILDRIAEVTGVNIVLFQSKSDANGELRGGIVEGIDMNKSHGAFSWQNDKIYIDINAGVLKASEMGDVARYSMLRTFTHEFTHFIEKYNPEQWETLRDAVFSVMRHNGADPDVLIDEYIDKHKGVSRDAASREVVAEAMTDILPETSFMQELAQKHRNVFEKLLDKLKEFVDEIKAHFKTIGDTKSQEPAAVKEHVDGVMKYAEGLVEMFDKIAVQAVENYQTSEMAQKNTAPEGGVQMQTRSVDGNQVVWIEENILKENQGQPVHQYIADYIAEHIGEVYTIIESGQKVYIGEDLPGEYTQSKYTQAVLRNNPNIVKAKNRASANLGEMIEIATNRRWEKTKHAHSKDAQYGIYRYDTRFGFPRKDSKGAVVGANIYKAELLIRNASDGKKYLYDIVNIKKDTASSGWLTQRVTSAAGKPAGQKGNVSKPSIPNNGKNVNNNSSGQQHQDRTGTVTNRDIIAESEGTTKLERDKIAEYQKLLAKSREQSQIMAERQRELDELGASNDPANKKKYFEILTEVNRAKNRRNNYEGQLRKMEDGVLAPLINREKGRVLEKLRNTYGTIPKGEKAVRDDSLPVSVDGKTKVSRTARTVKGAGVTPDDFAELIDTEVVKGGLSYVPLTNNESTQKAVEYIKNEGWEAAKEKWSANVQAGKTGADLVAQGALLLNNAAKAGDKEAWLDILHDYQFLGTNTAQGMQAMHILKKLQPDDKLYTIKRSIQQMVRDMKLGFDIVIDPELEKQYQNAKTVKEANKYLSEIQQSVADQIPSTWMDKWTALRYLNMLGNLRTQFRNLFGNTGMMLVTGVKDTVAVGLEQIAYAASGGKFRKTKSLAVSGEMLKAAMADYKLVESIIQGGGKYSDSRNESMEFVKAVRKRQRIFKSKLLEGYRKGTNWAMDKGDVLFSKIAYSKALSGYLKANGVKDGDFSKVDPLLMNEARLYAVQEAQEATFRDTNLLSGWVATLGRKRTTPAAVKMLSEGVMPFRKTPANVLVRAEEYSPLGVVNSLYTSIRAMQKGSDVTGAQVINSWAKSLTGTGLFALGMLFHNLGWLIGGPDEDEKQDRFDEMNGQQNYALKIGDIYVTIDFLSPAAIPMFIGAQIHKMMQDGGIEFKEIESAFLSITDPLIQMSMLQGVNDTLENIKFSEGATLQLLCNSMASYLTQGLTNTWLGQWERTFESSRMSTYVDKDSAMPDWIQKALGKASAKTPGLDYNQIPYINAWGEEEQNPSVVLNAIYNMLSPSYISKETVDDVSQELTRLNEAQSDVKVFPSTPEKEYGGRYLTAEEYVALAKAQGQTQRQIIEGMVSSELYEGLPDAYKAKAIEFAYDYARESAQIHVLNRDGFTSDWMAEIDGDTAEGILKHVIKENIKGMYLGGDIAADEAIKRRMEYHGDTAEEAAEKVAYWDFQTENPQYSDWGEETVTKYKNLAPDTAAHVIGLLGGLSAEDGYTNVRPVQKIEAIVKDTDLSTGDKDTALRAVMDEKLEAKYDTARDMGIGMGNFVQAYRKYQDTSGEGKKATVVAFYKKTFGISKSKAEKLYDLFAGKKE